MHFDVPKKMLQFPSKHFPHTRVFRIHLPLKPTFCRVFLIAIGIAPKQMSVIPDTGDIGFQRHYHCVRLHSAMLQFMHSPLLRCCPKSQSSPNPCIYFKSKSKSLSSWERMQVIFCFSPFRHFTTKHGLWREVW